MATTKGFSVQQQRDIRSDIVQKYNEINTKLNEENVRESRDVFIEKFILCETLYKIVLKKYLVINNKYTSDGAMKIQIKQVKAALKKAGYTVDDDLMDRLFSGTGIFSQRGSKSARLLRNGIEHEMNVKDLQEVVDRYQNLISDMDTFLTWIQL